MHISFLEPASHSRKSPVTAKIYIQKYIKLTFYSAISTRRNSTTLDDENKLFAESDRRSRCPVVCRVKYPASIGTESSLILNDKIKWENKHRTILTHSVAGSLSPRRPTLRRRRPVTEDDRRVRSTTAATAPIAEVFVLLRSLKRKSIFVSNGHNNKCRDFNIRELRSLNSRKRCFAHAQCIINSAGAAASSHLSESSSIFFRSWNLP